MDSTISFRAKSPVRKTRSKKKTKKLPFLTGTDDNNMTHYTQQYLKGQWNDDFYIRQFDTFTMRIEMLLLYLDKKEDEILAQEIREDLTTYEQIRHRITKLLQSEKAKEINRDVSLILLISQKFLFY